MGDLVPIAQNQHQPGFNIFIRLAGGQFRSLCSFALIQYFIFGFCRCFSAGTNFRCHQPGSRWPWCFRIGNDFVFVPTVKRHIGIKCFDCFPGNLLHCSPDFGFGHSRLPGNCYGSAQSWKIHKNTNRMDTQNRPSNSFFYHIYRGSNLVIFRCNTG